MTTATRTYADVARLSSNTPDQIERWCEARQVSADEAYRIFSHQDVRDDICTVDDIWENETMWKDEA